MSLKNKLYSIMLSVGVLMALVILVNTRIIYVFIDDVRVLMDDNLTSYKFQEALGNEVDSFAKLIRNNTSENEKLFSEACSGTEKTLLSLPYDYTQIGEARYAITWNIRNSYGEYKKQRDKVLEMRSNETGYITEVYKAYQMQEYLQDYTARLMKEVLDGGNIYYEERVAFLKQLPYVVFGSAIMALALFFYLTRMLTKNMITVLSDLVVASKGIEKNDFSIPDVIWEGKDEVGQLVYAFNKMKHSTQDYVQTLEEKREVEERLYEQDLERAELEQRFSEAQLQLLKSQLNPHFLFNTLNMISRMAQMEEAPISHEMLIVLSNLLRYSLRTTAPFAPLNQELKVVEDYMYIQEKRFGDRISWKIDCQVQSQMIELPVFLLQPLVENAVIHGISMKEEGGSILVCIRQEEDQLFIVVEDTGLGMTSEKLEQIRNAIKQRGTGVGIGMGNIYRRISAYYEQGEVSVDSRENEGTRIQITLGRRKQ
ncbi:sensor histidine kinase [Konateibacter massiliensis]|uniref:sensor histidine kinase n=1 Tax=Konateibacter massiliensis TaxID=2002841 RepID=UPI001F296439|nr:histidine kinase [Konateibacter massiliensis]